MYEKKIKEDYNMMTGTTLKIDNNLFNQFLKTNKEKIDSVVQKNPSISKSDEWRNEEFWNDDWRND